MAGQNASDSATGSATGNDYPAHERNYAGFVKMFKYGAIATFLIAMLVVYIISN